MVHATAIDRCKALRDEGKGFEDILAFLRTEGFGKGKSLVLLVDALGVDRKTAKWVVHMSNVWADVRQRDGTLHDSIADAVERHSSD